LPYFGLTFAKTITLKPLVSIVILNYNGAGYLEKFLPSVLATQYENFEVVVADNGSSDNSTSLVKEKFPAVKIITNTTNEGFAGGYNWALQKVKANYYVLLNSDVSVNAHWIEPMVNLLESDKTIAACQPKILSYNNSEVFEYAGAAGGWIDTLGYPFSRGRVFDVCEKDNKQYDTAEPIFWATGACMMIRSELFHAMQGFDASFFAHQEEIDLCWRLQLAGYKIYACPEAIVYHVGAGTLPRGGRKVFLNFRNNLIMLTKNLPLTSLIWKLPARFSLDAISAYKGLLSGDTSFFFAIAKAHFAYMGYVLSGKLKRTESPKALETLEGVYPGFVVYQYFIKNKQYFSKIVAKLAHY
jgi:GT2 family glycosyltransferase